MKTWIKLAAIFVLVVLAGYLVLGYASSYFGWYGYKKWTYRIATTSVEESRSRGVFVKLLNYKIDSVSNLNITDFKPFIEKGFTYGRHSSRETVPLANSQFPFQLSYNLTSTSTISVLVDRNDLVKFDSSNIVRGYLRQPKLPDTVAMTLLGPNNSFAHVKVWD